MRNIKLILLLASFLIAIPAIAAEYKIDSAHSSIGFKVRHLGISSVPGKFGAFEGTVTFDPKNIKASSTQAKIEAKSIDTQQAKRDGHLRTAEFLDTDKFPAIEFKSKEIKNVSGNKFQIVGDLTMRGVTKPVVLDTEFTGAAKDPGGNERAAFTATTKLNRQDYGVAYSKLLEGGGLVVGDEVTVTIDIEGIKAG